MLRHFLLSGVLSLNPTSLSTLPHPPPPRHVTGNLAWTILAARSGARLVPIANTEMMYCFHDEVPVVLPIAVSVVVAVAVSVVVPVVLPIAVSVVVAVAVSVVVLVVLPVVLSVV